MSYTVLDISTFQNISNYDKAAIGLDGVIMRVGYRGYGSAGTLVQDSKFTTHYNGFNAKLPIGVYFLSQAITEAEAVAEVNFIHNIIKNLDISFPIYIDSEWSNNNHDGRADSLTREARSHITAAFCDRCRALGYKSGVYASDSWFISNLDLSIITPFVDSFWVAKYSSYAPSNVPNYDGWQYTSSGSISGYSGNVDLSHFYKAVWKEDQPDPERPNDINYYDIVLSKDEFEYNGKNQIPIVTIKGLELNRDYQATVNTDPKNVGTYTINIKGINNFIGSTTREYKIIQTELKYDYILDRLSLIYDGSELKPIPTLENDIDGILVKDRDYTISYQNNINVGNAKINITGKGNYKNLTTSIPFTINPLALTGDISLINGSVYKYSGQQIKPAITVYNDGIMLKENTDYTVQYSNNINPNKQKSIVIVNGIGNYTGSLETSFSISKLLIQECNIILDNYNYEYTGDEIKPIATVIDPVLEKIISSYSVQYQDNINNGIGKVIITGKDDYSGSKTVTFNIMTKSISNYEAQLDSYSFNYTGNEIRPTGEIEGLILNKDYEIIYADNINVGTARAIFRGINDYAGQITKEFNINYSDISNVTVKYGFATLKSKYRVDNNTLKLYTETYTLEEDRDYTILSKYREIIDDFILYSFEIKGKGGFSGSYVFRFRIISDEPDYIIDYNDDGTYNFGDLDEHDESAVGNYDFEDLDEPKSEPTVVIDNENYDFDEFSMLYTGDYDIDDGKTVNENGTTTYDDLVIIAREDDGTYNFGDIDEHDETAVGDYDFGDLDEGVDPSSKATRDYDFNILAEEEEDWAGTEYLLENVPLYPTHCSNVASKLISGVYYVFNSRIANDKVRLCKYDSGINVPCRYVGWVKVKSLLNSNVIAIGDLVEVTGKAYKFATGLGGYTDFMQEDFYISNIAYNEDKLYPYPYAISRAPNSTKLGFVNEDSIKIITKKDA